MRRRYAGRTMRSGLLFFGTLALVWALNLPRAIQDGYATIRSKWPWRAMAACLSPGLPTQRDYLEERGLADAPACAPFSGGGHPVDYLPGYL